MSNIIWILYLPKHGSSFFSKTTSCWSKCTEKTSCCLAIIFHGKSRRNHRKSNENTIALIHRIVLETKSWCKLCWNFEKIRWNVAKYWSSGRSIIQVRSSIVWILFRLNVVMKKNIKPTRRNTKKNYRFIELNKRIKNVDHQPIQRNKTMKIIIIMSHK